MEVSTVTHYRLDGSGFKTCSDKRFSLLHTPPDQPRAHTATCKMDIAALVHGKAAGAWQWPPTPISCHRETSYTRKYNSNIYEG